MTMNNKFNMSNNNMNNNNINNNQYEQNDPNKNKENQLKFIISLINYYQAKKGWQIVIKESLKSIGELNSTELTKFFYQNQPNLNQLLIIPKDTNAKFSGDVLFQVFKYLSSLNYSIWK